MDVEKHVRKAVRSGWYLKRFAQAEDTNVIEFPLQDDFVVCWDSPSFAIENLTIKPALRMSLKEAHAQTISGKLMNKMPLRGACAE